MRINHVKGWRRMDLLKLDKILKGRWVTPLDKKNLPIVEHKTIYTSGIKKNTLFIAMDHETWAVGSGNKGSIYDNWIDTHLKLAPYQKNISVLIVQRKIEELAHIPQFMTENTYDALVKLSKYQRAQFTGTLIGVTGTVGKSSTQSFLTTLLSSCSSVALNEKNNNSRTGVRSGLMNLENNDYAVMEVAISALWYGKEGVSKEIAPDIAVFTQIGVGQAGTTVEKTARLKARLAKYLSKRGFAVVNRDMAAFDLLEHEINQYGKKIITYGRSKDSDHQLTEIKETKEGLWQIVIQDNLRKFKHTLCINHFDEGFVSNVLCAASVLTELGMQMEDFQDIFSSFTLGKSVLEEIPLVWEKETSLLIDDTYNAEELSMINAFRFAKKRMANVSGKKIAVLGRIVNLRNLSEEVHRSLVPHIVEAGFDSVITYGEEAQVIQQHLPLHLRGGHFTSLERCSRFVLHLLEHDSFILLKGSRRNSDIHKLRNLFVNNLDYYRSNSDGFDVALSTNLQYESCVYSKRGLGNLLVYLCTLEKLSAQKISLADKVTIGRNPQANNRAVNSVGLKQGDQYSVMELLQWAVSLNAPDALLALAEYVFGSNAKALAGLKKKSADLGLNPRAVKNISGRKCRDAQRTYLKDLQIIGNEFLRLPRSFIASLKNRRVILPNGALRMGIGREDVTGESFASIIWGDNESHGMIFKLVKGELVCGVCVNSVDYSNAITGINLAIHHPKKDILSNIKEVDLTDPEINIIGDTYFGEFYRAREMLEEKGYAHSFKNVKKVFNKEAFNILNYEAVFSKNLEYWLTRYKKFHLFSDEKETLKEFKNLGVDLALMGNNHANDFGKKDLKRTVQQLEKNDITTLGVDETIPKITILRDKKFKLAVFNGYWYRPQYDIDFTFYSKGEQFGVNLLPGIMCEQIKMLKKKDPEMKVLVIAHWGADFSNNIVRQRRLSEELALAGADMIVSSGAHLILPVEKMGGQLTFYGIGNGVFNSVGDTILKEKMIFGYILKLHISDRKLRIYPIYNYNRDTYYQPTFVDEEQIQRIVAYNEPENILTKENLKKEDQYYFELELPNLF